MYIFSTIYALGNVFNIVKYCIMQMFQFTNFNQMGTRIGSSDKKTMLTSIKNLKGRIE